MNHHLRILEERIQTVAVGRERAFHDGERVRREIQDHQKENLHRGHDDRSVREQPLVGFVAQAQHESVTAQQERPEQQRPFLPGPEHGELICSRQVAIAVMENVGYGEIIAKSGEDQDDRRQQHGAESGNPGAARGFSQAHRTGVAAKQSKNTCEE